MKPSMKVLQMCLTATEVAHLGNNNFVIKWGNNRETLIVVYEDRPTKDAPDKGKAPAKKASSKPVRKSTKKVLS